VAATPTVNWRATAAPITRTSATQATHAMGVAALKAKVDP